MTNTTNKKFYLHRSSRSIKRTVLPVALSGAGNDKSANAHTPSIHPYPTHPITPLTGTRSHSSNRNAIKHHTRANRFLKPRLPIDLAAFNVRTLMQPGQQAGLALTMDSLSIDICCVSETIIQDETSIMNLTAPGVTKKYFLRTSGDEARAAGKYGTGIALSSRDEAALVNWIPVNSRLCAARLQGSIKVSKERQTKRCLFVISAYAPTNNSSDFSKDSFYDQLNSLIGSAKSRDIVVLAGDMNAQVGKRVSSESSLGGRFALINFCPRVQHVFHRYCMGFRIRRSITMRKVGDLLL